VTLHSPLQIPFRLVASDNLALARGDGARMSDQPQSPSVWRESSRTGGADAYGESPALEHWLPPLWSSPSEAGSGDSAIAERPAPATLHDAAHALMNV
jgi:hypothetical protein